MEFYSSGPFGGNMKIRRELDGVQMTSMEGYISKFGARNIQRAMEKRFKDFIETAIGEFINAAVEKIHQDTGMSAASFIPLANTIRAGELVTLHPKRGQQKGVWSSTGRYDKSGYRSIKAGIEAGKQAYIFDIKGLKIHFEWLIVVWQYYLHENGFGKSVAWESITAGFDAMTRFIAEQTDNYLPRGFKQLTLGVS